MEPSPCNSVSSIQSGDDYNYYGKEDMITSDEKKDDTKPCVKSSFDTLNVKPHTKSTSTEKKSTMNNESFAFSSGTSGCTKEEDITKDDLQAMKDMIGDIKKDPSLLYRLSSLATGEGSNAFNLGALGGNMGNSVFLHSNALNLNNTVRSSIVVDDDHTEVSSLGMMSYDDHNSGRYQLKQANQFGNLGKLDQIASQQQFVSPLAGPTKVPTQELTASRTNRDVEIALRMQSLRAKKGLFNASPAGNTQYRTSQQLHKQPELGQTAGDARPRLNTAPSLLGQLGNAKLSGSASTPREQDPKPDAAKDANSPKVGAARKKNGEIAHRSMSAPRNGHFQGKTEERGTRKSNMSIEEQPFPPSQQGLRAPASAKAKQQTETPDAPMGKDAIESKGGKSQVVRDQDNLKDDDDSENSALVVYKEVRPSDITPHHENRKSFGNALAPSASGGYNNYALPFQARDSDVPRLDTQYHSSVSKYANSNSVGDHSSDHKLGQFKRSSSTRSTTRHQVSENDKNQRERSGSIQSKSARHINESEHRQSQTDRSKLEQQMDAKAAKKLAKSKHSEGSHRRRSQSETRRSEEQYRSSNHHPSLSNSEQRITDSRRSFLGDDISYQPKRGIKPTRVVMQDVENHHQHDRNIHVPKENDEGEENVDKVTSLPGMNFDASYVSLGDFVMQVEAIQLGEQLRRLNLRDGHYHDQESQSGRSVISRISHLVKGGKAPKRGSESFCSHPSSLQELHSSSSNGNGSPKKSIESDDGSLTQKTGRKLISRLSHSRLSHVGGGLGSPHQSHRRRTTTVENMNSSLTHSDWEKSTRSAGAGEHGEDFISHGMGDNLAFDFTRSSRYELAGRCDEKGRCVFHPHIRLQKQKLFGGWKVIFKHCPDCAVEQMKKTQKELAIQQLKAKRKKHKEKKDPFISELGEINVDETQERKSRKSKTKQKHSSLDDDTQRKDGAAVSSHSDNHQPAHTSGKLPNKESIVKPTPHDSSRKLDHAVSSEPEQSRIVERKRPKQKKVNGLPWSDYNGQSGRYTGEVNDEYLPHGRGEMVYDRGVVSSGIWYKGVLDAEVPLTQDEYIPDRLATFSVGDKGHDEDMIIEPKKATAAAVSLLRVSDAAFVRRSDGNWTYAVVKDRTHGENASIKFKVNARGSTKSFPTSQWGTYIRRIKRQTDAPAKKGLSLDDFLSNNRSNIGSSNSVAGNMFAGSSDHSVSSARSLPMMNRTDNLTTGKMNIRTRSRSRSKSRKNVTTLPLLFSSSMSVSEENEGNDNDGWETASGSGYRLRGIDP